MLGLYAFCLVMRPALPRPRPVPMVAPGNGGRWSTRGIFAAGVRQLLSCGFPHVFGSCPDFRQFRTRRRGRASRHSRRTTAQDRALEIPFSSSTPGGGRANADFRTIPYIPLAWRQVPRREQAGSPVSRPPSPCRVRFIASARLPHSPCRMTHACCSFFRGDPHSPGGGSCAPDLQTRSAFRPVHRTAIGLLVAAAALCASRSRLLAARARRYCLLIPDGQQRRTPRPARPCCAIALSRSSTTDAGSAARGVPSPAATRLTSVALPFTLTGFLEAR
jgi:hypothetical protein